MSNLNYQADLFEMKTTKVGSSRESKQTEKARKLERGKVRKREREKVRKEMRTKKHLIKLNN